MGNAPQRFPALRHRLHNALAFSDVVALSQEHFYQSVKEQELCESRVEHCVDWKQSVYRIGCRAFAATQLVKCWFSVPDFNPWFAYKLTAYHFWERGSLWFWWSRWKSSKRQPSWWCKLNPNAVASWAITVGSFRKSRKNSKQNNHLALTLPHTPFRKW